MKEAFLYRCIVMPLFVCVAIAATAQNNLRIHYKSGIHTDIAIESIDSITIENHADSTEATTLVGSWLWGSVEKGYYELLSFKADRTYTGYNCYFTYGFDTQTYGRYFQSGNILTLLSGGFGYNRRYDWFITGLTENALEVMTRMGPFTYYRLQPEVINMSVGDILPCPEGDALIFADGITATIEDNKLLTLKSGTTYIQRLSVNTGLIWSYKVVVE